ncbi:MAG: di-trans,poly-cis-decaprenylcistransferase, partial [Bryobacterales bacterium]|nr:di-trans,poly-cis-decaprenylcistransferase [Bryobacterales bacterium]
MQDLFAVLEPGSEEWRLATTLDAERIPVHVAVIMDGNGRWAKARSLPRVAGHKAGVEPVRTVVETCGRLGVKYLTLYAFSVENWKRPRTEVDTLWRLLRYYLKAELPRLMRNNVRLSVIGRVEALPVGAQEELEQAMQ